MTTTRLDEVCAIIMGQAPAGDSYNTESQGWPLIAGAGDFSEGRPTPKKYTTEVSKLSEPGDIILGIRASIGDKVLSDKVYCLGRGVAALRPGPRIDRRFLWHALTHMSPYLSAKGRGATFKQVNREDIGGLSIDLPPLDRQRRIAEVLDHADKLRARRRQALAKLDGLVQSIFVEMFGAPDRNPNQWPRKTIGDLLESATYGSSVKATYDGDLPILRMNNITSIGTMNLSDLKYVSSADTSDRHRVRNGDVLFNRTNSPDLVGKTAIYRSNEPMAFAGYLVRLRVNDQNNPEYLAGFLNTRYAKRVLRNMCKSIIGMANINARELQRIEVAEPPRSLQDAFAARVGAVEELKQKHRASRANLDALFASLQDRAFRGLL